MEKFKCIECGCEVGDDEDYCDDCYEAMLDEETDEDEDCD